VLASRTNLLTVVLGGPFICRSDYTLPFRRGDVTAAGVRSEYVLLVYRISPSAVEIAVNGQPLALFSKLPSTVIYEIMDTTMTLAVFPSGAPLLGARGTAGTHQLNVSALFNPAADIVLGGVQRKCGFLGAVAEVRLRDNVAGPLSRLPSCAALPGRTAPYASGAIICLGPPRQCSGAVEQTPHLEILVDRIGATDRKFDARPACSHQSSGCTPAGDDSSILFCEERRTRGVHYAAAVVGHGGQRPRSNVQPRIIAGGS